jgi:hypothetical protein
LNRSEGTASRVDQRHDQFAQALGQKGLAVERIAALDVSAGELFLARAIADLDTRLTKVEPKRANATLVRCASR